MRYEGNDKHKKPWQPGRKGGLCPPHLDAQHLLDSSVPSGNRRFALYEGRAYEALRSSPDGSSWHGFPVGWAEVPEKLWREWEREGKLRRRDRSRYWEITE